MATITFERLGAMQGANVVDRDGDRIGRLEEVFTDEASGRPEFLGIGYGFLRTQRTLVPVEGIRADDGAIQVPYDKVTVTESPDVAGEVITPAQEQALYDHYDLESHVHEPAAEPAGRTEAAATDDAAITRSEEELRVGTRTTEAGRIRLHKWVDTEHVEKHVPVEREEAYVEREPVNRRATEAEIGEKEVEVPLEEERVVAEKEAVAKERIGITKERRTDHETVSDDLRKERVEIDDGTR